MGIGGYGEIGPGRAVGEAQSASRKLQDYLSGLVSGTTPSSAQAMFQRGMDTAMAQTLATARSARGNPFLALRQAEEAQTGMAAAMPAQAAALKANEQMQAAQVLGAILSHQQDVAIEQEKMRQQQRAAVLSAIATAAGTVATAA